MLAVITFHKKMFTNISFICRLREVSDVAKMQVSALEARQQSREKEVESLRRQVLDYQVCFSFFQLCSLLITFLIAHLLLRLSPMKRPSSLNSTSTLWLYS